MQPIDRTGEKIGHWKILSTTTGDGPTKYLCECDRCGEKMEWRYDALKRQKLSGKSRCVCSKGSMRSLAKKVAASI